MPCVSGLQGSAWEAAGLVAAQTGAASLRQGACTALPMPAGMCDSCLCQSGACCHACPTMSLSVRLSACLYGHASSRVPHLCLHSLCVSCELLPPPKRILRSCILSGWARTLPYCCKGDCRGCLGQYALCTCKAVQPSRGAAMFVDSSVRAMANTWALSMSLWRTVGRSQMTQTTLARYAVV